MMINLCYHPTTLVFVDDDIYFLDTMKKRYGRSRPSLYYSNPNEALEFINKTYKYKPFIDYCVNSDEDAGFDHVSFNINLRSVRNEVLRKDRFSEISTVIVDYSMPQINGLEFCNNIQNPNIMKILLTGEGDANLAVEAFNEGLIDKFILKSTPDLFHALGESIAELEQQYFSKFTGFVKNKSLNKQFEFLEHNEILMFFNEKLKELNIVEYYILDETGGFMLVDNKGNAFLLVIMSGKNIDDDGMHAEIEGASKEIIDSLKNREKLLYIPEEGKLQTPPESWGQHLHPARKIPGEEAYFYTLLQNITNKDKITSFDKFLEAN